MAGYERPTKRALCRGINLRLPVDALPEGKWPRLQNVRPTFDLEITSRPGLSAIGTGFASPVVNSLAQLDDPTAFASQPYLRLAANGTSLYAGTTGAFSVIETGFSGDPMIFVPVTPEASPQPWMYIADSGQLRKVRVDSTVYGVGFAPPNAPPTAALQVSDINTISDFNAVGPWVLAGAVAGAPTLQTRVNTTIARIVYDSGSTGWASVELTAMTADVQPGIFLTFAGAETSLVQEVKRAIATTTIGSITYDSGSSGLCTIQPTASVAEGDLDGPFPGGGKRSSLREDQDPTPIERGARSRIFDLAADCLILLNASEAVRILSVTTGPDGIQSLRCSTAGTFSAGQALAGLASIRVYLSGTRAAGNTVATSYLRNVLTPPVPAPASMTGGIQAPLVANLALIGGRPTQPDDEIHLSIRISNLQQITDGRIYFDVDGSTNDFTRNYYMYTFRPSDLVPAVQQTNAGATQSVTSARTTAYQRNQIDQRTPPSQDMDGVGKDVTQPDVGVDNPLAGGAGTTAAGAVSGQMGAGVSQWSELRFKVHQLTRVGSDTSRTLANVQAVEILVNAQATAALTVEYDALWIGGAYGPDVGTIGAPLVYCYRPRSSVTGNKGNPSPAMRSGVSPRRQAVIVQTSQYANDECDLIDWYRLGGALTTWKFVASTPNSTTPTLADQYPDDVLASNPGLEVDCYQPWPTTDLPATSVVNVSGTAVTWVSGDKFKTNWAAGTVIQINGVYFSLYSQPTSDTFLELVENAGTIASGSFFIAEPLLLGTPLPTWWGDYQGTYFACGDPNNPGNVYWTKGNSPDVTSDVNSLLVTTPSTPLINGVMWDRRPFVFSSTDLFLLERQAVGSVTEFRSTLTPCGAGLWSRWAVCVGEKGVYFLTKDGIRLTVGGESVSVTDADLYPLFPHEGIPGQAVNGYQPPDMTAVSSLQLSAQDGYVYFDYLDVLGASRTMVFAESLGAWLPDVYATGVGSRFATTGDAEHRLLVGTRDNRIVEVSTTTTDVGTAIACSVRTPSETMGDPRILKQFGDIMFDGDASGGAGFTVTPGYNLYSALASPSVVLASEASRTQALIDITSGSGYLARDLALNIAWTAQSGIVPTFFQWQPAFLTKSDASDKRATDWDAAEYSGAKFVQGLVLRCDTFGQTRTVQVQFDGGQVGATLSVNHNGEVEKPYSFDPFIGHLVRLVPTDENEWMLLGMRWVYEPSPEATTVWRTQQTTHDLQGYQHIRDGYLAYMAVSDVTLTIRVDSQVHVYTFAGTGGINGNNYAKIYFPVDAVKGKYFVYALSSADPFRVFLRDTEIRVKAWGSADGYVVARPFGDISRESGARI
jgi:hypothetical protein